jgi:hypothetical protein
MKIAIIGAGWVGCHLALKLKDSHEVVLYEEDDVFSKTSLKNQNRLHLGFHYARSSLTRDLCKNTFNRFLNEYNDLVSNIPNNIYAIPKTDSLIDLETYLKIFDSWSYEKVESKYLNNIEGSIRVDEKYIDPVKSKKFFTEKLKDVIVKKKITKNELVKLQKDYDIVLNCTNNVLNKNENVEYQLNSLFIYEKTSDIPFGALTLVDGPLFSIFPYLDGQYLLSHVKYSPDVSLTNDQKVELMEQDVLKYFPEFKDHFKLTGVNESYKSKVKNSADPRVPVISKEDNLINIFTGKIQGIFQIEDYIKKEIFDVNRTTEEDLKFLFNKYLERDPNESEYVDHLGKDKNDFEHEIKNCKERAQLVTQPRVAVLLSGHVRDMDFLKTSYLIKYRRVDFFIFSWDQQGIWGTETELDRPSIKNFLETEYKANSRIKKYAIESNKDYIDNNPTDPNIKFFRYSKVREINIQSQLYAIMRSYQLMEEYVKETGIEYDLVVKTRFDMAIVDFNLTTELIEDVNKNKIIFVPDQDRSGHAHPLPSYCPSCDKIYDNRIMVKHLFEHQNIICDTYAYGSVDSMKKYCYLYESYEKLCKEFEAHNLSVVDKIKLTYEKDEGNYIIPMSVNNDVIAQRFLFCSYPERLFMHYLDDYLLPRARHIILRHSPV